MVCDEWWSGGGGGVRVVRAYRFALDPSAAQERALRSHAGAARFGWNWGLAQCQERYAAEGTWYSAVDLHKLWNAVKKADPALGWWAENSKCAYQEAFRDLDRALRDFTASQAGQRKGCFPGSPGSGKGRWRDSFRFHRGDRCAGSTVTSPRLGASTHEPTRKLARRLDNGTARILSATVSRTAQRWFVSFTVEVDRAVPGAHARPGSAIGIDLGVKTLLTGVDDRGNVVTVAGPKALRSALRALRRASRAHSRTARGSANRRRRAARLARIHARAASVRADALHKTTTDLARRYETVVAEDLNVAGMTRNHRLARAIADQGFGQARRMLGYKTAWAGGTLVLAGRFYPSTKTCSGCGTVKTKLALSERTYHCDHCGLTLDRTSTPQRTCCTSPPVGRRAKTPAEAAQDPAPPGRGQRNRNPAPHTRPRPGPPGRKTRLPATHPPK